MVDNARSDGNSGTATATRKASTAKTTGRAAPKKAAHTGAARKSTAGAAPKVRGRAAVQKVDQASHFRLALPLVGEVRLPEPQQLTYYAAVGALGVIGVLEWPLALVLVGGHALATNQHHRVLQQFGEALEDA